MIPRTERIDTATFVVSFLFLESAKNEFTDTARSVVLDSFIAGSTHQNIQKSNFYALQTEICPFF